MKRVGFMMVPVLLVLGYFFFQQAKQPQYAAGVLQRVPELQGKAAALGYGALSEEPAQVRLHSVRGDRMVNTTKAIRDVFGEEINYRDLMILLQKRIEARDLRVENPLSSNVSDLMARLLQFLSAAKDPIAFPLVIELLQDRDAQVRGWAAIALYRYADTDAVLRRRLLSRPFPRLAIDDARELGVQPPPWIPREE